MEILTEIILEKFMNLSHIATLMKNCMQSAIAEKKHCFQKDLFKIQGKHLSEAIFTNPFVANAINYKYLGIIHYIF